MSDALRIIGIDPGIARMGYGIIDVIGNRMTAVDYGTLETSAETPTPERLAILYSGLQRLLVKHQPTIMVVEQLFFYRNVTTAFVVGQARGVAILAGVQAGVTYAEYTPMQVKLAVTGYGKADKVQIQEMVRVLLNLAERPQPDDTADALAIAITHANSAWSQGDFRTEETVQSERRVIRYGRGVKP